MMGFHMISWLGDLHQATCCRNVIRKMYEPFDFQTDVLYTPDSSFEIDDFIADVDGFNIGFGLSTNKDNSELKVSDFINAYYEIIRQNPKNRYRFFIKFVSFDAENIATNIIPSSNIKWYVDLTKNTGENGFKFIVCVNMGVACDTYNDVPADFYYNEYNPLFKFLCKKGDENRGFPCVELRANMAREFIEYVFEKAA